jgi:ketosteroid isomerase-like protein
MGRRLWLTVAGTAVPILLVAWQGVLGDTSAGSSCSPREVRQVVERFVDAFNRGDIAQLDQLVSDQQFDWYATDAPGQRFNAEADDRSTLMAYFAARHSQHEHLVLSSVEVTFTTPGQSGFWFVLTRSADDGLPPTAYNGKGEVQCATRPSSVTVWAMDPLPWSPIQLLPEAAALVLLAAAMGAIVLWRRRQARHSTTSARARAV